MNRRNHDVEKQRYWQRTIGEAARSGMSIREFCRQRRLKESLRDLTCPSFCTSFNERVYITAKSCEFGFGTHGLQAAGAGGL